jgi:hypothetical protein
MVKRQVVIAGVLTVWLVATALRAEPPAKGRLPITISKATTYITEPLRPDGYPDYLAALNQMAGKGVTPENNAVVALMQAFGPGPIDSKDRDKFFKMLGVAAPPDKGEYFVEYRKYVEKHAPDALKWPETTKGPYEPLASRQEYRAARSPWSDQDCPLVAAWLAEEEGPLARVVEASRLSGFYVPAISHRKMDMWFSFPLSSPLLEAARALHARALRRLRDGDVRRAWSDLQACHRLGRLQAAAPTATEWLVGITVEGIARYGEAQFAHYARLTPDQARKCRVAIRNLPAPSPVADKFAVMRFSYLDEVCATARGSVSADAILGKNSRAGRWIAGGLVDWDQAMRLGNEYFDGMVQAAGKPVGREAVEAALALDRELERETAKYRNDKAPLSRDRAVATRGTCLAYLVPYDTSSVKWLVEARDRMFVYDQLTEIALALSAYRTEHGEYPKALAAIQPDYLPGIPEDPYTKGPFRYRRWSDGYMLYSVGPNGEDDGGEMSWGSAQLMRHSDDMGIRVPDPAEEEGK